MQNERTKKTKLVRRALLGLAVVSFLVILAIAIFSQKDITPLQVRGQELQVEIANNSQKRERGLCCRDSLPADQGMLFVYDLPGNYRFWMKDTRIPLDMIWVNADKRIVHIEHSVAPETYPQTFGSSEPAQYILETNAGFAKKYDLKKSDTVAFSLSTIDSIKLLLP